VLFASVGEVLTRISIVLCAALGSVQLFRESIAANKKQSQQWQAAVGWLPLSGLTNTLVKTDNLTNHVNPEDDKEVSSLQLHSMKLQNLAALDI
jgi:hypothetical protein